LEHIIADPAKYAGDANYSGHIFAVILLAYFKEQQAHQPIVDVFSLPEEYVSPLFEDTITEDLPILLYQTCGGSIEQIKGLVLNREAYEFCRSSALRALNYAVVGGLVSREEILDFYSTLFKGDEAATDDEFWSFVAYTVYELYPEELMDVIKKAFEDDLIDPDFIGPESFEKALQQGKEQTLARLREDFERQSLDDVHEHISWWAWFDEPAEEIPQPVFPPIVQSLQKAKKPGRNDPCWCGSGKKYKHCHLKVET
jgi:hypothetical protein